MLPKHLGNKLKKIFKFQSFLQSYVLRNFAENFEIIRKPSHGCLLIYKKF